MKRRKPGKALERIARAILDSDEFVDHIAGVAALYRKEHALDATPRGASVRQSLKLFRKHAAALGDWLEQSGKATQSTPEHDALNKIGVVLYGAAHQAHTVSRPLAEWLAQADAAAGRCLDDAQMFPRKPQRSGSRAAAVALRATFEHHKLKFALRAGDNASEAVRLLCAIAKDSGDGDLTAAQSKQALQESGSKQRAK